jgi:hypothetical protein
MPLAWPPGRLTLKRAFAILPNQLPGSSARYATLPNRCHNADVELSELKAWAAEARHGEQPEFAKLLGVPKQRVNRWIAGRKIPNLRDGLKLQEFLKKQRRSRAMCVAGMNVSPWRSGLALKKRNA